MNAETCCLATYRIQFNHQFRFEDARALTAYLSRLGITHLYSSPTMRARQASMHGYDIIDPTTLNPNLGDQVDFRNLVSALQAHGMGLILDIVPNHMAASSENPYWMHVLTYGLSSPYARWFDIDWRLPDPELWGRVSVPVLGEPLPRVLAKDQIRIEWNEGRFVVKYYDHTFPIDPATVHGICLFGIEDLKQRLEAEHPSLAEIQRVLKRLKKLPRRTVRIRRKVPIPLEEAEQMLSQLAQLIEMSPLIHDWVEATAKGFGEGEAGRERLRKLLDAQSYRLVHWRQAARVLNYRRFFDINDLISIRQEDPEVFDETHVMIRRWLNEGLLDGVRVDHIDGLRDPYGYLLRLAELVSASGPASCPGYIFVEKILAPDEHLPRRWPVAGTTGYEFCNELEALFISPAGFHEIEQNYRRLMRRPVQFEEFATWGKRRVLKDELSAFVGRLAGILMRLAGRDPQRLKSLEAEVRRKRDSQARKLGERELVEAIERELVDAVIEVVVALPVYRTYIDAREATFSLDDQRYLEEAIVGARKSERASNDALDFLEEVLLLKRYSELPDNERHERLNFIQRFQQLTGPATAKGIEDTALYAYVPLASRNEVGGDPVRLSLENSAQNLHQANLRRVTSAPHSMLCATTHDTKRTADVRSRLDVLSEWPKVWDRYVHRWRRRNRSHKTGVRGKTAPDAATEYLLYQTLIGIWPAPDPQSLETTFPDAEALNELCERVEQYMLKAAREAKMRTSWVQGDAEYEQALVNFVRGVMSLDQNSSSAFLKDLHSFVGRIARPGFWNALSRTLIQFTAPGTPDTYQGDELWNLALVDPDNRRPVDYERRRKLLDEILTGIEGPAEARRELIQSLVASPEDGRIKLHVVRTALNTRRQHRQLFFTGDYQPLEVEGAAKEHLFGFTRTTDTEAALILVPRLTTSLVSDAASAPIGPEVWKDTAIHLPDRFDNCEWRSELTAEPVAVSCGAASSVLRAADVLHDFPVALLVAKLPNSVQEVA